MGRRSLAYALLGVSAFGPMAVASAFGDASSSANAAIWLGLLVQLGWIGFAVGGALLTDESVPTALGWVRGRMPLVAWIPAVLGFLFASLGIHQLLVEFELRNVGQLAEIDQSLRSSGASTPWLAPLVAGLLPGFAEESLFRGFVLGRLRILAGPIVAVIGSAAVFGLAHFDWIHGTAALILGLYLGTLAWAARSIWPCVVAHGTNNLLGVLAILGAAGSSQTVVPPPLVSLAVAFALLLACVALSRRASPESSGGSDRPTNPG